MSNYKIFTRNWWKINNDVDEDGELIWPKGLEPDGNANKKTLYYAKTETEAKEIAQDWNRNNKPGRLSRKAEYTGSF